MIVTMIMIMIVVIKIDDNISNSRKKKYETMKKHQNRSACGRECERERERGRELGRNKDKIDTVICRISRISLQPFKNEQK